jgi:hypothetical protein
LPRRSPIDDEPGSFVRSAGDHRVPGEFEQVRLDGREISDGDGDGLEPSASLDIRSLARDAVDLGGQPHLVHGVEYRRVSVGPA